MTDTGDLVLSRTIRTTCRSVYAAFTEADALARWWGPDGFRCTVHALDARCGGDIRLDMHAPGGETYPMTATYEDLEPPGRVVFLARAIGPAGAVELESRDVVTFEELGADTVVTVAVRVLSTTATGEMYRSGMAEGWSQSLDRLALALER